MKHTTSLRTATLVAILFAAAVPAQAGTIFVNRAAAAGGDGSSWANAFNDLQAGLDEAATRGGQATQIWVAAGKYVPSTPEVGNNIRTASFQLINNTEVYGGFVGTETLLGQRDFLTNLTTLSGDLDDNDVGLDPTDPSRDNNAYSVVGRNATTAFRIDDTAALDGFTITAGNADHPTDQTWQRGGGISNEFADPQIRNCTFTRNFAINGGAAVT